ncbi:uncharacterized protein LOC132549343 [Ylistrum balloti]|uniref:uncharacterized protein LOC132549343 n=1 Tax=Ylistrum balloti TaxID=509963 RepID=UPI002905E5A1|nr:uncharacterized protein LOC132549343 [Ylistrum balloti]
MSWQPYVDETLKGTDKDDSYIAGIFGLDGKPLAVHPSTFSPSENDVKALAEVIDGNDRETVQVNGCMFQQWKYAIVRSEGNMVSLQRKRTTENEQLSAGDKWPLCIYKTKSVIIIRISKLGVEAGRDNTGKVGGVGDYLNAH